MQPCCGVRRLICASCLLLAWLCANGAVLDLMQVFAWGRMFTAYAHEMPVETALARTFDPARPCPLCLAVRQARRADRGPSPAAAPAPGVKLVLIAQAPAVVMPPAIRGCRLVAGSVRAAVRRDPVPVPPPRFGVEC